MPEIQTIQTTVQRGNATLAHSSWNAEQRSINADFASGKPVLRYSWYNDEYYWEELDMSEGAIDMTRINLGAAVLKDHRQYTIDAQVGITTKGWVEDGVAVCSMRLSERDDLAGFRKDVEDKILKNISVGYEIIEYDRISPKKKGEYPVYRAVKWSPIEVSFVAIPADETVGVRSLEDVKKQSLQQRDSSRIISTTIKNRIMAKPAVDSQVETPEDELPTRTAATEKPADTAIPAGLSAEEVRKIAKEATAAERARVVDIRRSAGLANMPEAEVTALINSDVSLDQAREKIFEHMEKTDVASGLRGAGIKVVKGKEQADKDAEVRSHALILRSAVNLPKDTDKALLREAEKFRGMSLLSLARLGLEERGISTRLMPDDEIAQRSITPQSTGEFPELINHAVNTILLASYAETEGVYKKLTKKGSLKDFKDYKSVRGWGLPDLKPVGETEEYENIELGDAKGEIVRLSKYGAIVSLSWEAIVNDDWNTFAEILSELGVSVERTRDKNLFALINMAGGGGFGPIMGDGVPMWHTTHVNLGTASAFSAANITDLKQKLRRQKNGAGELIGFDIDKLLIEDFLEDQAKELNDSQFIVNPTGKNINNENRSRGTFKEIIVSPRISDVDSYRVFAKNYPAFQASYYNGKETPDYSRHEDFRVDAMHWKVRDVIGFNGIDWRATAMNAGA